jgi:phage regulator Rha-like protein
MFMNLESHLSPKIISIESIEQRIFVFRGQKVMLDADLAQLYGVSTKRFNEQVKRNRDRFPEDFMFRLSSEEAKSILALRSQFATLKRGQHLKYAPYAFTEHGAVMVANVLNSSVAVHASIQVVRAFVRLREIMATHKDLAQKLEQMEKKYDRQFKVVFDAIRELMAPQNPSSTRPIGFIPSKEKNA